MNFLLINYEYPPIGGGAGNATRFLARALVKLGHPTIVLTAAFADQTGESEEQGVKLIRIPCKRKDPSQASTYEMMNFVFQAFKSLTRICDQNHIEAIINYFTIPCGPLAWWAKKKRNIDYVVSLRGGDVPGLVPELDNTHKLIQPIRRTILKKAKAIIANAQGLANLSRNADPFPVGVIPNGVDTETYTLSTENHSETFKFLFVGRFQAQKNLFFLLDQFKQLSEHNKSFELHIVGDGPQKVELHQHAEKSKLNHIIHWHGWLDKPELLKLYQSSNILINPSHYEGLPNVLLEGMACGLPIIASNIPGNNDLVTHEANGYLFDIGDGKTCQENLIKSLDPNNTKDMGNLSRKRVIEHYTWESVAKQYIALFK